MEMRRTNDSASNRQSSPAPPSNRRFVVVATAAVVVAAALCYSNSFQGAYIYDDIANLLENRAVRQLWPPYAWLAFTPPRAFCYFTFALNYAVHGYEPFGYHLVNLAIHTAVALLLFGLIRRTLRLPSVADRYRRAADPIAAAIALVWVVHPLCTQAVTYVYQRIESLSALVAVAACYAFVRGFGDAARPRRIWVLLSLSFVYLATVTKESIYLIPVILLIFDRLFMAGTWRGVLVRRRFHAATFCSWAAAVSLMWVTGSQYSHAGIGHAEGPTPIQYALGESGVLLHYLRLCFWPTGLCLDYDWPLPRSWYDFVPQTIVVLAVLGAVVYGLAKGRLWSFPGCVFFLILAPTSSIIPIDDLAFEHRMYLPLAAVLSLVVCGVFESAGRLPFGASASRRLRWGAGAAFTAIVVACGSATYARNDDYRSETAFLHDQITKVPNNPASYHLLGNHYFRARRFDEAVDHYRRALEIAPGYSASRLKLATILINRRRLDEAENVLRGLNPAADSNPFRILIAFADLRAAQGRSEEAERLYRQSLLLSEDNPQAMNNLGLLWLKSGRTDDARMLFQEAAQANVDDPAPRNNLGIVYRLQGDLAAAEAAFRQVLNLDPKHAEARSNLGAVLDRLGRPEEALAELRGATKDQPDYIGGWINLGTSLARHERFAEAVEALERAVALEPTNVLAIQNLEQSRLDLRAQTSENDSDAADQ